VSVWNRRKGLAAAMQGLQNEVRNKEFSLVWPSVKRLECLMVALEISHCTNVTSKYGDLALQVGGASDETVKYGLSSVGLQPKSDCSGKAQKQLFSNLQTRPLVREGATKLQTRNCLKISRRKKNWSQVPEGHLTPGQTGWLTVGRQLTATASTEQLPVTSCQL
jgi:hypothetical protein